MPLSAKLRTLSKAQLSAICFYSISGFLLLAFLPLAGFPPHVGFLGILSLITAYSIFFLRSWSPWLVFILFITNSGFALYTIYVIRFSDILVALTMISYALITWVVTASLLIKRKF